MKLSLSEPKYLKDSILVISELVNTANLKISKDKIELIAMDPANVAMIIFKLLSSAFSEYSVNEEKVIGVNLASLTQILKRVKPTDSLTLQLDETRNRLNVILNGMTTKKFELALLDIEEREQKIPNLKFSAKVESNTLLFNEAIEDMDIIADSLSLMAGAEKFVVSSEGNVSSGKVEISNDEETLITAPNTVSAKYSVEYMKKIVKGSKLSNNVILEFAQDYPLRVEYRVIDKLSLTFILAPRMPTD